MMYLYVASRLPLAVAVPPTSCFSLLVRQFDVMPSAVFLPVLWASPIYTYHKPIFHSLPLVLSHCHSYCGTSVHMSHWVPDFKILSRPLHNTRMIFSVSTAGPGFVSTPPINNRTAKVVAHITIVRKPNITCPFPCALRYVAFESHEILAAQVHTHAL